MPTNVSKISKLISDFSTQWVDTSRV